MSPFFALIASTFRTCAALQAEILALRHTNLQFSKRTRLTDVPAKQGEGLAGEKNGKTRRVVPGIPEDPEAPITRHYATFSYQSQSRELTVPFSAEYAQLLQLGVLRLGCDEDGNVGVGDFPEGEVVMNSSVVFPGASS